MTTSEHVDLDDRAGISQDLPRKFIMYSYACPSSPKSVTQTQLAPTTFLGFPSLSILQRPAHSPSCLLSGTSIKGTFFSKQRPCTNFLYVGSLHDSASMTTCALPASMCLATSWSPRTTPSAMRAFFKTL